MRKLLLLIIVMVACSLPTSARTNTQPIDTTAYYAFHLNYWFNMHHFLWMEAFLQTKADSTLLDFKLPKQDKQAFDEAVKYYSENLADQDPRWSDYMYNFKVWLTDENLEMGDAPDEFSSHVAVLKSFDETYQKQFWPIHKKACEQMLAKNMSLIRATEEKFVEQITKLTRQFWQFDPDKVRIELSYFAKSTTRSFSNNPYTTNFPMHVVMCVAGQDKVRGDWLELLYHESAHNLILGSSYFVAGTIKDLAEAEKLKLPIRDLEHAYLFYFTGQISKKLLEEQGIDYPTTYMERGKIYSKYFPSLERHLTTYMNRKITLSEATRRILNEFQ